jgi:hypothetical protein
MLNIIKQKNKNLAKSNDNKVKLLYENKHSNYLDIVKDFPSATKE